MKEKDLIKQVDADIREYQTEFESYRELQFIEKLRELLKMSAKKT